MIAEIMAWEEGAVEKIIRRYVDRQAAIKAAESLTTRPRIV